MAVRLHQRLGDTEIHHVEGKKNVADPFAKEMKDAQHCMALASAVASPRLLDVSGV